ncbi:hypothetical protein MKW92_008462, partial [Papaver armeniacum]
EGSADVGDDSQSAYVRDSSDGVWIADITKEQNKKRKRSSPVENDDPMDDSSKGSKTVPHQAMKVHWKLIPMRTEILTLEY